MASMVFITSSLLSKPLITVWPKAKDASITLLWEIDLSPGIVISPFKFLLFIDCICKTYFIKYYNIISITFIRPETNKKDFLVLTVTFLHAIENLLFFNGEEVE